MAHGPNYDETSSSNGEYPALREGTKCQSTPAETCACGLDRTSEVLVGICGDRLGVSYDRWFLDRVASVGGSASLLLAGRARSCLIPRRQGNVLSSGTHRKRNFSAGELSQAAAFLEWDARRCDLLLWLICRRNDVEETLADRSTTEDIARRGALLNCNAQRGRLERASRYVRANRRRLGRPHGLPEEFSGLVGERLDCNSDIHPVAAGPHHVES